MYDSSEEAIAANEPVHFRSALGELRRHGIECTPGHLPGTVIVLEERSWRDGRVEREWITLDCRSKAILEWLGY